MTLRTSKTQNGFTLLELLLVIGVAALLLIGGIATYRLVADGNKATESTRLLLTLRQETQTMAQQQGGNYSGIVFDSNAGAAVNDSSPLVTSGILRNNQRNPFNGNIVIAPVTVTSPDDNVSITFTNVTQAGCGKLAVAINNANEVVQVDVNSTVLSTFPITAAAAAGACAPGSANTIVWQFP